MKSLKIIIILVLIGVFVSSTSIIINKYYENKFKVATATLIENLKKNEKDITDDIAKKDNYSVCIDLLNDSSNRMFPAETICKE